MQNAIIFRTSAYKSELNSNELVIPGPASDLSFGKEIELRTKGEKPSIGFCGWANVNGLWSKVKLALKALRAGREVENKGLYFRQKALLSLVESDMVGTNFKIRSSYGAHKATVELDVAQSRKEFIDNLKESDFALTTRGDGNYSTRFFEALSLGRPVVLVDTDTPLPLEDVIDYDKFVIRVSHDEISRLPEIISRKWSELSGEDYKDMQIAARRAFEDYLRIDTYFKHVMTSKFLNKI